MNAENKPEKFNNEEEAAVQNVPTGDVKNIWERKETELLTGLDKKVQILVEFEEKINGFSLETSPEEVEKKLEEFFDGVKSRIPPESVKAFEELKKVEKEIDLNEEKQEDLDDSETGNEKWETLDKEWEGLVDRRLELGDNDDVLFLQCVENEIENLAWKNKYINSIKGDRKKIERGFSNVFSEHVKKGLDIEKIKDIVVESFGIFVVLDRDYYKEVDPESGGTYFSESCFSIIKDSDNKKHVEGVIAHERVHNLIDGIVHFRHPKEQIGRRIRGYQQDAERYGDDSFLVKNRINSILKTKPYYLLNDLHNEILASLEDVENKLEKFRPVENLSFLLGSREMAKNVRRGHNFSLFETAGNHAKELSEFLLEKSSEIKNEEVKKFLKQLESRFVEEFVKIGEVVRESLQLSRRIGPEAEKEIYDLFILLQPTQFRHIKNYLKFKHKERMEIINLSGAVSLAGVERLEKLQDKLNEEDKEILRGEILDSKNPELLGINSAQDLKKFIDIVARMAEKIEMDEQDAKDFIGSIKKHFSKNKRAKTRKK